MDQINSALQNCNIFISIGTSGNVYPAAGFYQLAKTYKAHTVQLNLEKTGASFDTNIVGLATEVVPTYFQELIASTE
jgi:NAD-dependent deacetylase